MREACEVYVDSENKQSISILLACVVDRQLRLTACASMSSLLSDNLLAQTRSFHCMLENSSTISQFKGLK